MRKPLHSFLLAQGNSPREDFLFDEEKNSWQLPRTAMSFSLRQRGNPHEGKILLGGGMVESNEFFSSSNRKSSQEKILVGGGGSWGLPHWQWQKFLTVCFIFLPEEKLISLPFYTWGNPPWPKGFYSWPRDHEDYLIDNDRIFDLVAAAGTSCKFYSHQNNNRIHFYKHRFSK